MKTIKLKRNALSFFLSLLSYTLDAQLYVTSSGNVGTGINNPTEKLRVVGNTSFTSTTNPIGSAPFIRGSNAYLTPTTPGFTFQKLLQQSTFIRTLHTRLNIRKVEFYIVSNSLKLLQLPDK